MIITLSIVGALALVAYSFVLYRVGHGAGVAEGQEAGHAALVTQIDGWNNLSRETNRLDREQRKAHGLLDGLVLEGDLLERIRLLIQRLDFAEGLLEGAPVDGGEFLLILGRIVHRSIVLVEKIEKNGAESGQAEVEGLEEALREYELLFSLVRDRRRSAAEDPMHAEAIAAHEGTIERLTATVQEQAAEIRKARRITVGDATMGEEDLSRPDEPSS